jgi:aspartyl-tRNA(Asn)/glutamyl-tRNA(Gln) amidotransferase subunit B
LRLGDLEPMNAAARSKLITGATGDWEVVIGMEVHAQVASQSKLFSGASTAFGGEPNAHVSLVDAAMPGMLPVINEDCIKQAVRTGLGLKAHINRKSVFDRKNYFYPDLPQGYQISQYKSPIVGEGEVLLDMPDGETVPVGIERLHLEQDAGKLLHDRHPTMSFVDLNRSGVALMEIVSKPDMRSADEAKAYVTQAAQHPALSRHLRRRYGEGPPARGRERLGAQARCAARHPLRDQECQFDPLHRASHRVRSATADLHSRGRRHGRAGDAAVRPEKGETRSMRNKEEAHDYRYFPDPDLLPLELDAADIEEIAAQLPELPDAKKARFTREHGLSIYDAGVLVAERETAEFFEAVVGGGSTGRDPKAAANWIINELAGRLNKEGKTIAGSPVSPAQLGSILDLIAAGTVSGKIAKDLFEIAWSEGGDPKTIVETRGMKQVTDLSAIEKLVDDILHANPEKVAQARTKPALIGWFVGQVMKSSGGKANPQTVNDLLKRKLMTDDG